MEENQLKRMNINVRTVVFMIFCICAAGAYGMEEMIPLAGPGLTIIMLLIIPIVWSLPMALTSAELGAAMPVAGGSYIWVQKGLGEFWGFQMGWWKTLAVFTDSTLYVILTGNYMGYVLGLTSTQTYIFQVAMIIAFVFLNLKGLKNVGLFSTIISGLVIVLFAVIAVVGFTHWNLNPMNPFIPEGQSLLASLGGALAIGLWMFAGYEGLSSLAGEVSDPKVIPKATLIALPLVVAVYLLPTVGGLASIGSWDSWSSEVGGVGYGTVLMQYVSPALGVVFGIVAVMAQCSMYNTLIAGGSRVFYAIADDNLAPKIVSKVNKKHNVPVFSIVLIGIINIIICSFDFTAVVVIDVLLILSFYVLIFIAMIVLRKKMPEQQRPLKIPGSYPFIVLMCCIPISLALITFLISGTDYFLGGLLGVSSGPIMYLIWKRKYGGLTVKCPEENPINKRTKLAPGDVFRMSKLFGIFGIVAFAGRAFLPWYEGDWGPDYYAETYGFDIFDKLLNGILVYAVVAVALSVILFFIGKNFESKHSMEINQ